MLMVAFFLAVDNESYSMAKCLIGHLFNFGGNSVIGPLVFDLKAGILPQIVVGVPDKSY